MATFAACVALILAGCGGAGGASRSSTQTLASDADPPAQKSSLGAPSRRARTAHRLTRFAEPARNDAHAARGLTLFAARNAHAARRATHHRPSRLQLAVAVAKHVYADETRGAKLHAELARIAHDPLLLGDLGSGDVSGAQAEAEAQLRIPFNHLAHVTRIGVVRGARALVNATVNADGVFVIPPAMRTLRLHGRTLGTLQVSIQDVTGFVKLVHDLTGMEVLARGASERVRVSPGLAAESVQLPAAGAATIAGGRYLVRSFGEIAWGAEASAGEPLTVWVLERA
jgi:hypothetical protein